MEWACDIWIHLTCVCIRAILGSCLFFLFGNIHDVRPACILRNMRASHSRFLWLFLQFYAKTSQKNCEEVLWEIHRNTNYFQSSTLFVNSCCIKASLRETWQNHGRTDESFSRADSVLAVLDSETNKFWTNPAWASVYIAKAGMRSAFVCRFLSLISGRWEWWVEINMGGMSQWNWGTTVRWRHGSGF